MRFPFRRSLTVFLCLVSLPYPARPQGVAQHAAPVFSPHSALFCEQAFAARFFSACRFLGPLLPAHKSLSVLAMRRALEGGTAADRQDSTDMVQVRLERVDGTRKTHLFQVSPEIPRVQALREIANEVYNRLVLDLSPTLEILADPADVELLTSFFEAIDRRGKVREIIRIAFGRPFEIRQGEPTSRRPQDASPGVLWDLAHLPGGDDRGVFVGVNIGSTYTRCVVLRGEKILGERSEILWHPDRSDPRWARPGSYAEFVDGLDTFVRATLADAGVHPHDLKGIGIGTVGIVRQGEIVTRANVTRNLDEADFARLRNLKSDLAARFGGTLVRLEMDSKVLALGEGQALNLRNVVVIKVGTAMGGHFITPEGLVLNTFEEIRHILVDGSGEGLEDPITGVKGTLRSYATVGGLASLSVKFFGRRRTFDEIARLLETGSDEERKAAAEAFTACGRYLGNGLLKLQGLFGNESVILTGKNFEGRKGRILLGGAQAAIREHGREDSLHVMLSPHNVDQSVAVGAARMAQIDHAERNEYQLLAEHYGLSSEDIAIINRIERNFGVEVLQRPGRLVETCFRMLGWHGTIDLFVPNELIKKNRFVDLEDSLNAVGTDAVRRLVSSIGANDIRSVLRAIREVNLTRMLEQLRSAIAAADLSAARGSDAEIVEYRQMLTKIASTPIADFRRHFEEAYLADTRSGIELYSGINPFLAVRPARRAYDRLFGLSAALRKLERMEERLSLRVREGPYSLRFYRRDGSNASYRIYPYAGTVHPGRPAVSVADATDALLPRIEGRLRENGGRPVVIRIDGRPGNRKSHSIAALKAKLAPVVKDDEIALIEVNDYKRPDVWLFDSGSFYRDLAGAERRGYKVILVEGTVIELFMPAPLPAGDFSIFIESEEPRRMEYLLNGDDKGRLEYFLRHHARHNMFFRHTTDVSRGRADVIINTYLVPRSHLTAVPRDLPLQEVCRLLEAGKYYLEAQVPRREQSLIAQSIQSLMSQGLVSPTTPVRINVLFDGVFVALSDHREIGISKTSLNDERFQGRGGSAVLTGVLYMLIKEKELRLPGLDHQPLTADFVRKAASLYLFANEFLPAMWKQDGRFLAHYCAEAKALRFTEAKVDDFERLIRALQSATVETAAPLILEYLRRASPTLEKPVYYVDLKNISSDDLAGWLKATLPTSMAEAPTSFRVSSTVRGVSPEGWLDSAGSTVLIAGDWRPISAVEVEPLQANIARELRRYFPGRSWSVTASEHFVNASLVTKQQSIQAIVEEPSLAGKKFALFLGDNPAIDFLRRSDRSASSFPLPFAQILVQQQSGNPDVRDYPQTVRLQGGTRALESYLSRLGSIAARNENLAPFLRSCGVPIPADLVEIHASDLLIVADIDDTLLALADTLDMQAEMNQVRRPVLAAAMTGLSRHGVHWRILTGKAVEEVRIGRAASDEERLFLPLARAFRARQIDPERLEFFGVFGFQRLRMDAQWNVRRERTTLASTVDPLNSREREAAERLVDEKIRRHEKSRHPIWIAVRSALRRAAQFLRPTARIPSLVLATDAAESTVPTQTELPAVLIDLILLHENWEEGWDETLDQARAVAQLARALREKGHRVILLYRSWSFDKDGQQERWAKQGLFESAGKNLLPEGIEWAPCTQEFVAGFRDGKGIYVTAETNRIWLAAHDGVSVLGLLQAGTWDGYKNLARYSGAMRVIQSGLDLAPVAAAMAKLQADRSAAVPVLSSLITAINVGDQATVRRIMGQADRDLVLMMGGRKIKLDEAVPGEALAILDRKTGAVYAGRYYEPSNVFVDNVPQVLDMSRALEAFILPENGGEAPGGPSARSGMTMTTSRTWTTNHWPWAGAPGRWTHELVSGSLVAPVLEARWKLDPVAFILAEGHHPVVAAAGWIFNMAAVAASAALGITAFQPSGALVTVPLSLICVLAAFFLAQSLFNIAHVAATGIQAWQAGWRPPEAQHSLAIQHRSA